MGANGFAKWLSLLHAGSVIALVVLLQNLSAARMMPRNQALSSQIPGVFYNCVTTHKEVMQKEGRGRGIDLQFCFPSSQSVPSPVLH